MIPELAGWFESESAGREAAARRALVEHLNQALRLLRQTADFSSLSAVLLDAGAPFSKGAAVFRISGDTLRGERLRGVTAGEHADCFAALELPVSAVASFGPALEMGDPVVALGGAGEISGAMVELLAHTAEERICVFPILAAGKPAGLLYAWGEVEMAALELLTQAASLVLANGAAPPRSPDLVAIAGAPAGHSVTPPARRAQPDWERMPQREREAHLRARRFARVQVAEMRLYHAGAVASGRARRDLYGALEEPIQAARDAYRRQFLDTTPGMSDYLHEELLHTLANDDTSLLGPQYAGPLV